MFCALPYFRDHPHTPTFIFASVRAFVLTEDQRKPRPRLIGCLFLHQRGISFLERFVRVSCVSNKTEDEETAL